MIQDGVSSDNTIDIIKVFRDANSAMDIKIYREQDKGPYDAMNKGIQKAKGEWFYFLGSDDELHDPNVLKSVMGNKETTAFKVLYGNVKVIGDAGWASNNAIYDGIFSLEKLLNRNICHQAIFYRATFAREVGDFNLNYVVCADWDYNMRCWSKTECKYLDLIIANFNAGGISSTGRPDEYFSREVASNVLKYFNLSISNPLVSSPSFVGFGDIVKMQESKKSPRRILSRIYRAVERRLKLTN